MNVWAYIYEHPDTDPVRDRTVLERAGQRSLMVPVPSAADAPRVARQLVDDEGVALVELCGGFPVAAAAAVAAEVGPDVAVGHVTFAADALPAAARYAAGASA